MRTVRRVWTPRRTAVSVRGKGPSFLDVNAAQVLTVRGEAADAAWRKMGCPLLVRPKPRLRRTSRDQNYGAGSAPYEEQPA